MIREIHAIESVVRGEPGHHGRGTTALQKLGLRYERKVELALSALVRNLGPTARVEFQLPLHFRDANGPGTAILDFLLTYADLVVAGETKLTWTPEAVEKLQKFYLPIAVCMVEHVRVRGLIVCRSLVSEAAESTPILPSMSSVFAYMPGSIFTLPWRGQRPMVW